MGLHRVWFVSLVLLLGVACEGGPEDAKSLESRLLAPCCYKQTLDVHSSDLAGEVRGLIRRRMGEGAGAAAVEAELVAKYGERIRAVPSRGWLDPLGVTGLAVAVVSLVAVVLYGRRLRRAAPVAAAPAVAEEGGSRRQLEAELASLDP